LHRECFDRDAKAEAFCEWYGRISPKAGAIEVGRLLTVEANGITVKPMSATNGKGHPVTLQSCDLRSAQVVGGRRENP